MALLTVKVLLIIKQKSLTTYFVAKIVFLVASGGDCGNCGGGDDGDYGGGAGEVALVTATTSYT